MILTDVRKKKSTAIVATSTTRAEERMVANEIVIINDFKLYTDLTRH